LNHQGTKDTKNSVLKIGGNEMRDPAFLSELADAVRSLTCQR
jgi:hypothetical protein